MDKMRDRIIFELNAILTDQGKQPTKDPEYSTPIFETGLDSLGFAMLVARLEETLGFDPFAEMSYAFYPKTFGEFLSVYTDTRQG